MANEIMLPQLNSIQLSDSGDLDFRQFGEILVFSEFCEGAGFLPKGVTAKSATLAIVAGKPMGLGPFAAIQNISVINGRPAIWGDAVGGLVKASGLLEDEWEENVGSGESFEVKFHVKRKGETNEHVGTFGYQDAKRAGLWGKQGPWTQYPKRMMFNRARAFAYRDAFPDVLKGIRIAEEEQDAPIDITNTGNASPAPYAVNTPAKQIPVVDEAKKPATASDIMKQVAPKKATPVKKAPAPAAEPVPAAAKESQEAKEAKDIFGEGSGDLKLES